MKRLFLSVIAFSSFGLAIPFLSNEAQAATVVDYNNDTITLSDTVSDPIVGDSFTIKYQGFNDVRDSSSIIPGLTAEALFKVLGFSYDTTANETNLSLQVDLDNTSDFASRVSTFGFDVNPTLKRASTTPSTTGGYTQTTIDGSLPHGFGSIDVCFRESGGNCQGGGNGGPQPGDPLFTFFPELVFSGNINTIVLSNFGVRFQGFTAKDGNGDTQTSAVGTGQVPTPAMLPGLVGMGVAALRKRKQTEEGQEA